MSNWFDWQALLRVATDLPNALNALGRLLNSRIGLAVLFMIGFNWGLSPKIDALIKSNEQVHATLTETNLTIQKDHDILTRLIDRCEFPVPAAEMRGQTALVNK